MVVNRSQTSAPGYGDLNLGGEELEEVKYLRILGATFDSKLTFEAHLREVVSKATRDLYVVRQAGNFFDTPRVLKSCFNATWSIGPLRGVSFEFAELLLLLGSPSALARTAEATRASALRLTPVYLRVGYP